MDFTYSEEQNDLRDMLRKYLTARSSEDVVRRLMETETGFDFEHWRELAGQLGLPGLAVPEQYGGAGLGFVEVGIVLEELGAVLACVPFFSSFLSTNALLLAAGTEGRERWLPAVVSGERVATVAVTEGRGNWDLGAIQATAEPDGDGWRVSGTKTFVLDGYAADLVLVAARLDGSVGLLAVDSGADGFTATTQSTMDQTRRFGTLSFESTPATLVAAEAVPALIRLRDLALAALSAEQVGGARRCLDLAVNHAKNRIQFGRPIGSFQAIKHKCADLLILLEAARAASTYALWCADHEPADLPLAASMAKAVCSDAFFRAAADNIQIHGGIGFTWEHSAHLYFKRAKSSELWWGDAAQHYERIGMLLKLGSGEGQR